MRTSSRPVLLLHLFATIAMAGVWLIPPPLPVHAQETGNVFRGHVVAVTAGDTMDVRVSGSWTVTVRLHGVDCPTTPRALRETATRYTSRLVLDTDVRVMVRGTASRSVVYGEVYTAIGSDSVNIKLVRDGLAKWANEYAAGRTDLSDAQTDAQQDGRGLWSVPDGSNVVLPPSVADTIKQTARERVAAQTVPASSPSPTVAAETTHPAPTVLPSSSTVAGAKSTFPLRFSLFGGIVLFVASLLALLGYGIAQGLAFTGKRFVAQVLLALMMGLSGAMAFALPIASLQAAFSLPLLCALVGPLLALILLSYGLPALVAAVRLRGTPVDPRRAEPGFVKLQGVARTLNREIACSEVGNIQGLYVREITSRYTSETSTGKRLPSPRWITLRDTTIAVDFEIFSSAGDGTGSAVILADQDEETPPPLAPARWFPYHVARFYNEVPTDAWFATAYEGDTRSEVFFVPSRATLTVWGTLYPPVAQGRSNDNTLPVPRIAPDGTTGILLICDGPEARAYSGRGGASLVWGASLAVLGVGAGMAAIYGILQGSDPAKQFALATCGIGLIVLLTIAIRQGVALSRNAVTEATISDAEPIRRPASIAWTTYQHGFPGVLIAPAIGD